MRKVSAFYLEKQKTFIPNQNMIQAVVSKQANIVPTDGDLLLQFSTMVLIVVVTCFEYIAALHMNVIEKRPKYFH